MPRDRLALAVLISREEEFVSVGQCPLQIGDSLLLRVRHDVIRFESVFDVDGELAEGALLELGRQVLRLDEVADVANRRLHLEAIAEILGDRLCLGGRLDDDEFLRAGHGTPWVGTNEMAWLPPSATPYTHKPHSHLIHS